MGSHDQGIGAQLYLQWCDINLAMLKSWGLKAVIDLGLPDILAKAGQELTAFEIAQKLPRDTVNVDHLYRLLTYVSSLGVFKIATSDINSVSSNVHIGEHAHGDGEIESGVGGDVSTMRKQMLEQRRFGATPLSMALTEECSPNPATSLANVSRFFYDKLSVAPCYELAEVVLSGKQAFHLAHGVKDGWELTRNVPEWGVLCNKAMAAFSVNHMDFILQSYKGFEGIKVLVDVGGGLGASIEAAVRAYAGMRGINFDRPPVIAQAPEIAGVKHVSGDVFESVPEGDAIFMKNILHDWTDEQCVQILKNCHKALPPHGKVIVADYILPPVDELKTTNTAYHNDLLMMVYSDGRERSKVEFQRILAEAGFPRVKVFPTAELGVIEGYKS